MWPFVRKHWGLICVLCAVGILGGWWAVGKAKERALASLEADLMRLDGQPRPEVPLLPQRRFPRMRQTPLSFLLSRRDAARVYLDMFYRYPRSQRAEVTNFRLAALYCEMRPGTHNPFLEFAVVPLEAIGRHYLRYQTWDLQVPGEFASKERSVLENQEGLATTRATGGG